MRKTIIAGNWKMNLTGNEAQQLFDELKNTTATNAEIVIFPPSIYIQNFVSENNDVVKIGAQNAYPKASGAFTGEISFAQLKSIGVTHVLIGHSERRDYFCESNTFLKEKTDACIEQNMTPVFCCGEPLAIREKGDEFAFVTKQISESLFHLDAENFQKVVIAYEPIWAIGTGLTATSEQAEEMHSAIRGFIASTYGKELADEISILYGGSMNEKNAQELLACPNVDGGLIGGASLKAETFLQIVNFA